MSGASGLHAPAPKRICPDCGNDDHEPSADACWICDCPLDAAPDPQRAYLTGMVRSDRVKRKGWFGGSVSVTTVVLVLGLSLLNPLLGILVAVSMVVAAKSSRNHPGRRTFFGRVLKVLHVLTIIVMFIVGAAAAGIFVLFLICMSSGGGVGGHF